MKTKFIVKALLACSLIPSLSNAATVSTDPVGAITKTFQDSSDTSFTLPLSRSCEFVGVVDSIVGNDLAARGASWSDNEWVYGSGPNPANTYFVLMTSGTMEGMYYTILGNSLNNVLNLDSASTFETISQQGVLEGDSFKIIPYWTLNSLFPNGDGLGVSPDPFNPVARLFVTDNSSSGINLPFSTPFFYHDGSVGPAGWYIEGDLSAGTQDDFVLAPDNFFVIRNNSGVESKLVIAGEVPMNQFRTIVGNNQPGVSQDVFIGVTYPIPMNLAELGLENSSVFSQSSDPFNPVDRLMVFDNSNVGINKPLGAVYFYHDGSVGPQGWYIEGNLNAGTQDLVDILNPGDGLVLRLAADSSDPDFLLIPRPY